MSTKKVHQGDKKRNCGWPRHFDMGKHTTKLTISGGSVDSSPDP